MDIEKRAGRTIGVLMLLQIPGAILVNFVLLKPLFAPPGYLVNAAPHATQVSLAVLAGLAASALSLGIAITAWPVLRRLNLQLALWFLALAIATFALHAVENTALMSLLSLSQAYAQHSAPDAALFDALRGMAAASRNWLHYVNLIITGAMILVFYATLLRFALVPRVLAALGVVAALLQMTAVSMPLFGHPVMFPLLAPLGLCQLALAAWLLAKGFPARAPAEAV